MRLIGMLDSPYVRRVAISMQLLGLRFTHEPLSVFSTFREVSRINPVVKVPTLVLDDGQVLMDSTLILDWLEGLPARRRSLMPTAPAHRLVALRVIGLALAACEKGVQIVYEHAVRPPEKAHAPWLERLGAQLVAACDGLEAELGRDPWPEGIDTIGQAGISAAVAWHFLQQRTPAIVVASRYPALAAYSVQAEALQPFLAAPHGSGTCIAGASLSGAA